MQYIWQVNNPVLKKKPTIHKIALHMCLIHDVNISDIRGEARDKPFVDVREKIAFEARDHDYTQTQIADYLNRTHGSINHYFNVRN